MFKRFASGIMLTLLLTSMMTFAFEIQPTMVANTVHIRADSSSISVAPVRRCLGYFFEMLSSLSFGDKQKLTQLLQIMSAGWNQTAADQAYIILSNKTYSSDAWEEFFSGYFFSNPLTDDLHLFLCHPFFYVFDDEVNHNLQESVISSLLGNIETIMENYSANLSNTLNNNPAILQTLAKSHALLDQICTIGDVNETSHQRIYYFYKNLTLDYPQFLQSNVTFNVEEEPYLATLRAQVYASFQDALPLSSQVKDEISECINLSGLYLGLWNDFGVIVMDNNGLSHNQLVAINETLCSIPPKIHNLKMITQNDLLGNVDPKHLWIYSSSIINILNAEIGAYQENQFPEDISPVYSDFFHMILVHEVNHIVDAYYISSNKTFLSRKSSLIEDAGDSSVNYLRSMLPDGFFTQYPQEFFASISNQWFCDSFHTLELGLARLENGYVDPINQFLFFADVYSVGSNSTVFYRLDEEGNITRTLVPLTRDYNGHIDSLEFNGTNYYFNVDYLGRVFPFNNTIWIMSDGGINPAGAPISTADNITYTLTANFSSSIIAERDNITIDGAGHTIAGPTAKWGIYVRWVENATIVNLKINSFEHGILLDHSLKTSISANSFANNSCGLGIYMSAKDNVISANNFTNNHCGLEICLGAADNNVSSNTIILNSDGIRLSDCSGNFILRNDIRNNTYGIQLHEVLDQNLIFENNITANTRYGIMSSYGSYNIISRNTVTTNSVDGILFQSSSHNIVSENNVEANNYYGIKFESSNYNTISENKIEGNGAHGVLLDGSSSNNITRNCITSNNWYGMYFWHYSNYNNVAANNVTENDYVIWLLDSYYNTFHGNNFINNEYQVLIYPSGVTNFWNDGYLFGGNYWSDYTGVDVLSGPHQNETGSDGIGDTPYTIDYSNIDNYPLLKPWTAYKGGTVYIRADGSIEPSGAPVKRTGELYTLIGNIISNVQYGIVIERSNIVVDGNGHTIQGSADLESKGIDLSERFNVTIRKVEIKAFEYGIRLDNSSTGGNIFLENRIANNTYGIYLFTSAWNTIAKNSITNNSNGIFLYSSSINTLLENNITDNLSAIRLHDSCRWNRISKNNITNNGIGVGIMYSSWNNTISNNNFISNSNQTFCDNEVNFWNNNYPAGGNYWSDYSSVDLYSGPFQNETGSDGIVDHFCMISEGNVDLYPLMNPYPSIHAVSVDDVKPCKTIVGLGLSMKFNVTLNNEGHFLEIVNVTLCANLMVFMTCNVTLAFDPVISIIWNTTGFAKGNYSISAYVSPVLGEILIDDNNFTDGFIIVSMVGDITSEATGYPDGRCDMSDIYVVCKRFGKFYPNPDYVPNYDIDGDGRIDMSDIYIVCKNFGKIDP